MKQAKAAPIARMRAAGRSDPSHSEKVVAVCVTRLGENDVLLGRGTGPNEFGGNVRYRNLVTEALKRVCSLDDESSLKSNRSNNHRALREKQEQAHHHANRLLGTKTKHDLAKHIVMQIKMRKGRFMKLLVPGPAGPKGRRGSNRPSFAYELVADSVAILKTKQTFRHQLKTLIRQGPGYGFKEPQPDHTKKQLVSEQTALGECLPVSGLGKHEPSARGQCGEASTSNIPAKNLGQLSSREDEWPSPTPLQIGLKPGRQPFSSPALALPIQNYHSSSSASILSSLYQGFAVHQKGEGCEPLRYWPSWDSTLAFSNQQSRRGSYHMAAKNSVPTSMQREHRYLVSLVANERAVLAAARAHLSVPQESAMLLMQEYLFHHPQPQSPYTAWRQQKQGLSTMQQLQLHHNEPQMLHRNPLLLTPIEQDNAEFVARRRRAMILLAGQHVSSSAAAGTTPAFF